MVGDHVPRFPSSQEYAEFAAQLMAARKARGLTQYQLANKLGRPQSYIAKIERVERRVDVVEFVELLDALDTEPNDFFERIRKARTT
ncbi:transcriptional regulator with XRE-family HTH domain [Skermanella aerolata]|jgi:transcriptional regulator with XRE-family HTH domain|uniref:helix-turn-helix domain-containing protein n=1 Tax=Skermanella aerolata TaxID=393310 RepID=UPI003D1F229D